MQQRKKGDDLVGMLMERLSSQDVPLENHHELRVIDATPDEGLLEANVLGGGKVVAATASQPHTYGPTDAASKGTDERSLPKSGGGSLDA